MQLGAKGWAPNDSITQRIFFLISQDLQNAARAPLAYICISQLQIICAGSYDVTIGNARTHSKISSLDI